MRNHLQYVLKIERILGEKRRGIQQVIGLPPYRKFASREIQWCDIKICSSCILKTHDLPVSCWEAVLSDAVHSVQFLLNTSD